MSDKPNLAHLLDGVQRYSMTPHGPVKGGQWLNEADVLDALSAAPQMGVKVKPLEWWEPSSANNWTHGANCLVGAYYVHIDGGRHQAWLEAHVQPYENTIGDVVGDLWAAKAAAQADYEARLLAALSAAHHVNETPKSEHAAGNVLTVPDLVEAGKVEANLRDEKTIATRTEAADTIRALIALATAQAAQIAGLSDELQTMKTAGVIEVAVRNPSVSDYMHHWEARAEAAEAKVAELEAQIAGMIDADTVQRMLDSAHPIMAEACRGYEETIADLQTDAATLRDEVERLRGALEFYADEENYKGQSITDPCGCCSTWYEPKIHIDGEDSGDRARAALEGKA